MRSLPLEKPGGLSYLFTYLPTYLLTYLLTASGETWRPLLSTAPPASATRSTLQPCNPAALQPCNPATLQPAPPQSPQLSRIRIRIRIPSTPHPGHRPTPCIAHRLAYRLPCVQCRIFCARMSREVERLNAVECGAPLGAADDGYAARSSMTWGSSLAEVAADCRLGLSIAKSALLPALYPLLTLFVCWQGICDM